MKEQHVFSPNDARMEGSGMTCVELRHVLCTQQSLNVSNSTQLEWLLWEATCPSCSVNTWPALTWQIYLAKIYLQALIILSNRKYLLPSEKGWDLSQSI